MNETDWKTINDNMREFIELGALDESPAIERSASLEHEIKKMEIYTRLRYEGRKVLVNPTLKSPFGGLIPDLLVIDLKSPIAYEVLHSEKLKEFKEKAKMLPFKSIPVWSVAKPQNV